MIAFPFFAFVGALALGRAFFAAGGEFRFVSTSDSESEMSIRFLTRVPFDEEGSGVLEPGFSLLDAAEALGRVWGGEAGLEGRSNFLAVDDEAAAGSALTLGAGFVVAESESLGESWAAFLVGFFSFRIKQLLAISIHTNQDCVEYHVPAQS